MPSFQRQETLPERPGDKPDRLISRAVAITSLRALVSAADVRCRLDLVAVFDLLARLVVVMTFLDKVFLGRRGWPA